jgi:peptide deformylase
MAVLPIRMAGDPVLRQKAKKVGTIDATIQKLIDDMIDTMRDAPGVGLAGNQVGVPLRVIVIEVPDETDDDEDGAGTQPPTRQLFTLINPQIVKRSGQRLLEEGCLSLPGYKAELTRSVTVTVKGQNRDGREVRIKAQDNLLAEALEHEIDHINGILYIDHLETMDELISIERSVREEDADGDGTSKSSAARSRGRSAKSNREAKSPARSGGNS